MLENESRGSKSSIIRKIFKYEFISTARIFVPVYSALLVIAFLAGIFIFDEGTFESLDNNEAIFAFILPIYVFFLSASGVITLTQLSKRLKKSLFGNEAYLNLTLPATIGEHITGRYLSAFVWSVIFCFVSLISLFLILINAIFELFEDVSLQNLNELCLDKFNTSAGSFLLVVIANIFVGVMLLISFIAMVHSVGHLAKKFRGIVNFGVIVGGLIIFNVARTKVSMSTSFIFLGGFMGLDYSENFLLINGTNIAVNIVFTAICTAVSYLILRFKLNLE